MQTEKVTEKEPSMLTVKQVAMMLAVGHDTVRKLAASGKLRCCHIGNGRGVYRFSEEHIREYLWGAEPVAKTPVRRVRLKHLKSS
jgi:excisionase family DNA binding protein